MNVTLHLGDCLEYMRGMDAASVDCVITSPPYNMRTRIRNGEYTERERSDHFSKKYSGFDDSFPIDEYLNVHRQVIKEALRVAPLVFINIQLVTGSKEAWFNLMGEFSTNIKDVVVWDKGDGQPAMHPAVINRSYELILILEASRTAGRAFTTSYFPRGTMQDVWRLGRGGKGEIEGHGAVFPLSLPSRILNGWTLEGDTILDPFMGSGTTGVACVKLGRKFLGVEMEPKYFEIAKRRIIAELERMPLFEEKPTYRQAELV